MVAYNYTNFKQMAHYDVPYCIFRLLVYDVLLVQVLRRVVWLRVQTPLLRVGTVHYSLLVASLPLGLHLVVVAQ